MYQLLAGPRRVFSWREKGARYALTIAERRRLENCWPQNRFIMVKVCQLIGLATSFEYTFFPVKLQSLVKA